MGLGILIRKHLIAKEARPAVRWMNGFAVIACALGLCAWLTTLNVMEGLQKEIRLQHLALKPHLLLEGPLRKDLTELSQRVEELIKGEASSVRVKLQMEGLLEPLRDSKIFTGSGIVIEGDSIVEPGTLVMGSELSYAVDASSMDSFRLRNVWNLEGAPLELKLAETRQTGLFDIDRFYVWVSNEDLHRWLGNDRYHSRIEIYLSDPFSAPQVLPRVQSLDSHFRDWTQLDFALWHSLGLEKKAMALSLFFLVLFGALAVSSALSLRIAEKRREIGLLRAVGATNRQIFWVFESEALILAAVAFAVGLILSAIASWAIESWGMLPRFFYSRNLPVDWSWERVLLLYTLSLFTVALVSAIPAKRIFRWDIASLLRS